MPEDGLSERVGQIEGKLDTLSASVDARFAQVNGRFDEVDKRFDEVREHFVELREYIDFASDRLDRRMTKDFTRMERKLDQLIDAQSRPRATTPRHSRPPKRRR